MKSPKVAPVGAGAAMVLAAVWWIAPAMTFQGVGGRTRAVFDGGTASTGPLPLDIPLTGHAYVAGRIGAQAVPLLIDSGAGATVMDLALANSLALPLGAAIGVKGTVGATSGRLITGVVIEIGALRLGPLTIVAIDLASVTARLGRNPVILGRDVFESTIVEVDYPAGRVTFHDADRYRHDGAATETAMHREGDKYQIDVVVDGRPTRLDLDSGSDSPLTLFEGFARAAGLPPPGRPVSTTLTAGAGASVVAQLATVDGLAFAGMSMKSLPAIFPPATEGGSGSARAGSIGADVLRRFRVTFDAPHQRVFFDPGPDLDRPFQKDRVGLRLAFRDGALHVLHVSPGSPAAADGWTTTDVVTSIDDHAVTPGEWTAWAARLFGPAGTRITMRDGRGAARTLVLRDYY